VWAMAAYHVVVKQIAHHEDGQYQAGNERGMPKIRPIVALWPRVRLMTKPPMKRIKPSAMAKEKL